jgi:hypothetical protein
VPNLSWLVFLILAAPPAAHSQQSEIIPLPDAAWQFHAGDDPHCASVSGSGCTLQSSDNPLEPREWQRSVVNLPNSLRSPQQLGLLMGGESSLYEVFVNGHLIGSNGSIETTQGPYISRAIFSFPSSLAQNGSIVVSIHATNLAYNLAATLKPSFAPAVGPLEPIRARFTENTARHLRAQWQHYLCFLLVFCIGLFFLLLYILDRGLPENLWLALLLCGTSSIRFLEFGSFVDMGLGLLPANLLYCFVSSLLGVAAIQFSFCLIKRRAWPFFRLVQFAAALDLISLLAYLPFSYGTQATLHHMLLFIDPVINVINIFSSLSFLVPTQFCFRNPLPEMRWIGAALLFLCFEDTNRQLGHLVNEGVLHIGTVPQHIPVGNLDFDLRAMAYLLFSLVMLIAMTVRFRRLQSRNQQVELDMEAARTVQRLLIPSQAPETPGFTIQSVYLPAQEVGGDFFHVSPAHDGSVLLVVGDVSGKGLSAALSVSVIIGALRSTPMRDPAQVLGQLNQAVYGFISAFATCCVALLTRDGQLTLANAGHLSPYRNGVELSLTGSLPLGVAQDVTYTSEHFSLDPGDHLTFVSDGEVESTGRKGELFGFERTAAISRQSAQRIADAAQSFGEGIQADDITVLTLVCDGL